MRIPSTQALRALDSFARHGSVWRAADELHLTRSAVSHQLRLLERDLGFELLQRDRQGRHADAARPQICQRCAQGADRASTMQANGKARLVLGGSFMHQLHAGLRFAVAVHPYCRVPGDIS